MNIPEEIFKAYDIRGTYPDKLNEESTSQIFRAIFKLFSEGLKDKKPKIVLGRDMRLSSPSLHKAAVEALVAVGAEVVDIGVVSTPTVYFATRHYGAEGGVQISASHNPKEYNGIKIVKNSDKGLLKIGQSTGMDKIKEWSIKGVDLLEAKGSVVEIHTDELLDKEVDNALKIAGNPEIKKFKIVADAANAMGAEYLNALFKKVPADLVRMNFELDGTFPAHQADPLQFELLKDLQERVVQEGADLGLAPDGDGDRLMFIDEKGEIVKPSVITALVARELLRENKGEKVLFDIRYIYSPQKVVEENGGEPVLTRIGHAFITEHLAKVDGIFAGESSGHYYYRATGYAESQLPTILLVLKAMTRENKKLSEIAKELERGYESGEINFKVKNAQELMKLLQERFSDGEVMDIDGIAISYPDWRFLVRTSNTEPLLRLTMEHLDPNAAEAKKEELIKLIEENAVHD